LQNLADFIWRSEIFMVPLSNLVKLKKYLLKGKYFNGTTNNKIIAYFLKAIEYKASKIN